MLTSATTTPLAAVIFRNQELETNVPLKCDAQTTGLTYAGSLVKATSEIYEQTPHLDQTGQARDLSQVQRGRGDAYYRPRKSTGGGDLQSAFAMGG